MRYGIYLTFDRAAEDALQALRRQLAAEVEGVPKIEGKMRPHLTLLVFDETDHEGVLAKFKALSKNMTSFSLVLSEIGAFLGRRNVLYVAPQISVNLKECYLRCLHNYSTSGIVSHHRNPAKWNPHVTLAKGIDDSVLREAKALAMQEWMPMEASVRSTELIDVQKPLEVMAAHTIL